MENPTSAPILGFHLHTTAILLKERVATLEQKVMYTFRIEIKSIKLSQQILKLRKSAEVAWSFCIKIKKKIITKPYRINYISKHPTAALLRVTLDKEFFMGITRRK